MCIRDRFLSRDSLEHLRIFFPTTCVGLRYGPPAADASAPFLGSVFAASLRPKAPLKRTIPSVRGDHRAPSAPGTAGGGGNINPLSIAWRPVSYTHLDVYKRQVLDYAQCLQIQKALNQ